MKLTMDCGIIGYCVWNTKILICIYICVAFYAWFNDVGLSCISLGVENENTYTRASCVL